MFYQHLDNRELKFNFFKLRLAHLSNEIDEDLFEQIFGHTLMKLANKLINTTNKEKNQIIVKNISKNKDKIYEKDKYDDWVIQPSDQCINLLDTIKLIVNFNKEFNYENENGNENENEDNEKEKEKESENENDDETMSQNKTKKEIIKRLNDDFDKIIDKSKSSEDQIESLKKLENLNYYYYDADYDKKELKLKIFKLQIARLSNIIKEKLFKQIFGHKLIKLANKVINKKK